MLRWLAVNLFLEVTIKDVLRWGFGISVKYSDSLVFFHTIQGIIFCPITPTKCIYLLT